MLITLLNCFISVSDQDLELYSQFSTRKDIPKKLPFRSEFIRSAKNSSGKRNHKQLSNALPSAVLEVLDSIFIDEKFCQRGPALTAFF